MAFLECELAFLQEIWENIKTVPLRLQKRVQCIFFELQRRLKLYYFKVKYGGYFPKHPHN